MEYFSYKQKDPSMEDPLIAYTFFPGKSCFKLFKLVMDRNFEKYAFLIAKMNLDLVLMSIIVRLLNRKMVKEVSLT